jgi:hypothetical protein
MCIIYVFVCLLAIKISQLSDIMDSITLDQQRLDNSLEYAKDLQTELEAYIVDLEASLPDPTPTWAPPERQRV